VSLKTQSRMLTHCHCCLFVLLLCMLLSRRIAFPRGHDDFVGRIQYAVLELEIAAVGGGT
jgi:hypothetical protein